jgi:hypothetical protein
MTKRRLTILTGVALAAVVLAGVAFVLGTAGDKEAPAFAPDLNFVWAPATTGVPAVKYEVEIRKGGPGSTDITTRTVSANQIVITEVAWLTLYEVRVRGVDADNRSGPWSQWSNAADRDNAAPSF